MGIGPAPAIRLLLERCGLTLDQIARFEINEAQGAQTIAVERELGLDRDRLNVNGGAIALGHPLAATGLRLRGRRPGHGAAARERRGGVTSQVHYLREIGRQPVKYVRKQL